MAGRKGEENRLSEEAALAVMLTGFMQVTHLALVELIRCRGGIGPWFDEFQAKVIHELRNPLTEDVGMSDESQFTDVTVDMTNTVFDGAREDSINESSGSRHH